jgi:hypothetical protein
MLNKSPKIVRVTLATATVAAFALIVARHVSHVDAVDQTFSISIGSTVQNGQPAAGAGNIENAGDRDIYSFTGSAGQHVFFDGNPLTGSSGAVRWTLLDPSNNPIFQNIFITTDGDRRTLPATGTYTITTDADAAFTGTYNFRLTQSFDQSFNISIGDTVQNAQPSAGAGNIENPGDRDIYTFTGTAGQHVYFDGNPLTGSSGAVRWTLRDPANAVIFQNSFITGDPGRFTLPANGTYTITTAADAANTGTYNFRLTESFDQSFGINIGDTVQNGQPAAGAGNIENPGDRDIYSFSAVAGQKVFFDGNPLGGSTGSVRWTLRDPSNGVIFQNVFVTNDPSPATQTLPADGDYTIITQADSTVTGTYNFQITAVPSTDVFNIGIGDTVSPGSPATGAGSIESAGSIDEYNFTAGPNQNVYFDGNPLGGSNTSIRWTLTDPSNAVIFQNLLITSNPGKRLLTASGNYKISPSQQTARTRARTTSALRTCRHLTCST